MPTSKHDHTICISNVPGSLARNSRLTIMDNQDEKGAPPAPDDSTSSQDAGYAEETPEAHALVCMECGAPLVYRGSGRRPRYCSSSCRHRAWERRRAAAEGLIAKEIVELPARPTKTTYTRAGVVAWLQDHPRRFAEVVAALPDTAESVRQLDAARRRLRNLDVPTLDEHRAEERAGAELTRLRYQHARTVAECERLRRENRMLRERLSRAVEDTGATPAGSDHLVSRSAAVTAGAPMASGAPQHPAGSPPALPGYRVVTVAGRTFHVPQAWSRAQARTWCRAHPDKALD